MSSREALDRKGEKNMNYIVEGIKVGDKVWTVQEGDTEVISIDLADPHPIMVERSLCYKADGRHFADDKTPSLFWSKPYSDMPKKPEPPKYQWLFRQSTQKTWDITAERITEKEFLDSKPAGVEFKRVEIE